MVGRILDGKKPRPFDRGFLSENRASSSAAPPTPHKDPETGQCRAEQRQARGLRHLGKYRASARGAEVGGAASARGAEVGGAASARGAEVGGAGSQERGEVGPTL